MSIWHSRVLSIVAALLCVVLSDHAAAAEPVTEGRPKPRRPLVLTLEIGRAGHDARDEYCDLPRVGISADVLKAALEAAIAEKPDALVLDLKWIAGYDEEIVSMARVVDEARKRVRLAVRVSHLIGYASAVVWPVDEWFVRRESQMFGYLGWLDRGCLSGRWVQAAFEAADQVAGFSRRPMKLLRHAVGMTNEDEWIDATGRGDTATREEREAARKAIGFELDAAGLIRWGFAKEYADTDAELVHALGLDASAEVRRCESGQRTLDDEMRLGAILLKRANHASGMVRCETQIAEGLVGQLRHEAFKRAAEHLAEYDRAIAIRPRLNGLIFVGEVFDEHRRLIESEVKHVKNLEFVQPRPWQNAAANEAGSRPSKPDRKLVLTLTLGSHSRDDAARHSDIPRIGVSAEVVKSALNAAVVEKPDAVVIDLDWITDYDEELVAIARVLDDARTKVRLVVRVRMAGSYAMAAGWPVDEWLVYRNAFAEEVVGYIPEGGRDKQRVRDAADGADRVSALSRRPVGLLRRVTDSSGSDEWIDHTGLGKTATAAERAAARQRGQFSLDAAGLIRWGFATGYADTDAEIVAALGMDGATDVRRCDAGQKMLDEEARLGESLLEIAQRQANLALVEFEQAQHQRGESRRSGFRRAAEHLAELDLAIALRPRLQDLVVFGEDFDEHRRLIEREVKPAKHVEVLRLGPPSHAAAEPADVWQPDFALSPEVLARAIDEALKTKPGALVLDVNLTFHLGVPGCEELAKVIADANARCPTVAWIRNAGNGAIIAIWPLEKWIVHPHAMVFCRCDWLREYTGMYNIELLGRLHLTRQASEQIESLSKRSHGLLPALFTISNDWTRLVEGFADVPRHLWPKQSGLLDLDAEQMVVWKFAAGKAERDADLGEAFGTSSTTKVRVHHAVTAIKINFAVIKLAKVGYSRAASSRR